MRCKYARCRRRLPKGKRKWCSIHCKSQAWRSVAANREKDLLNKRKHYRENAEEITRKLREQRQIARSLRSSWQRFDYRSELELTLLMRSELNNPRFVFEYEGKRRVELWSKLQVIRGRKI